MYRFFFLAQKNIRKQKGDMITFFILSALASLLIFISVSFLVGTGRVIDTNREKINAADLFVCINNNEAAIDKLEEIIRGNVWLKNYETQEYLACSSKYRHKGEKNWVEYPFNISRYAEPCTIQTMSMDASGLDGNEAVIPVSLSTSYAIGDVLQLKIEENVYDLKVAGFNEDNLYCSPMNLGTYKVYVSDRLYRDILFDNPNGVRDSRYVKTQLSDTARKKHMGTDKLSDQVADELHSWYSEYMKGNTADELSCNILPVDMMKTGSMILPFVFIALVLLFALIMLVIAIVIINFSVKNFIMVNMRNTAIMEAAGYTVRELVVILLTQLLIVAGAGAAIGIAAGAALIDKAGIIILITLGLKWNQPFSVSVALGVLLGICLLVGALTLILGREYSRTSVLDALRGGVNTHNYKKNLFAFDRTALPIAVTLALKETFGKFRSQLGVIFIMMILTVSTIIALGMADTYGTDDGVLEMSGLDVYDAYFAGSEAMCETVAAFDCVKDARREMWMSVKYRKKKTTQNFSVRAISDTSLIRGGSVVEGRWPSHPNEVMLATNAAAKLGVGVGDAVSVEMNGGSESYIVCGMNQTMNNMGLMTFMTLDGLARVSPIPDSMEVCVNLRPGATFADLEREFHELYPDVTLTDYNEAAHQTVGMITGGMKLFAYFITVLTILIVAFVESLIVRTSINRQWRNLGVSKALGFTSGQLIRQVMMSNLPAILIGIAIGLSISPFAGGKLMIATMAIFGFKKISFGIRPLSYLLTTLIICGVALATAAFMGRRIKKLEPVKMITEE